MATRNQSEGHRWERVIAQILRNSGVHPHTVTCRSTNRTRDGQGIDFCNRDEHLYGRMQDDVQAKTTADTPNIEGLLRSMKEHDLMDERMPVIFWRKTGKSSGGKFMEKGKFAMCYMEDYLQLLKLREFYKAVAPHLGILMQKLQDDGEVRKYLDIYDRLRELDLIPEK